MKNIILSLFVLNCLTSAAFAQSATTSFDVDGIKVIYKPTEKEIINVRVVFRGGVSNYPATQGGIEAFTLAAATDCGTEKYTANAFRDRKDAFGIDIGAASDYDYGNIDMDCVSRYFGEAWDLMSQAVIHPVFDNTEVELLKNKLLDKVNQESTDPETRTEQLLLQNAFAGTPYATDPAGSEETLSKLTAADLKAYYAGILNKKQLFIVVAGKISKDELTEKIQAAFAGLPDKPYNQLNYQAPAWTDHKVATESRQLSTNYIEAIMNAPAVSSPDFVAYRMGLSVLGGALFSDLRTKLHLSYDPGAYAETRQMSYGLMHVSTNDPKTAVREMVSVLERVRDNGISDLGLKYLKGAYFTSNYIKLQSTAAITGSLATAEVLGALANEENLPQLIDNVTVKQINQTLKQSIIGLRWAYLGNPDAERTAEDANAFKDDLK